MEILLWDDDLEGLIPAKASAYRNVAFFEASIVFFIDLAGRIDRRRSLKRIPPIFVGRGLDFRHERERFALLYPGEFIQQRLH